jgi:DNA polymerase-3 subunit alpha
MGYVPLHVHTDGSTLDGAVGIKRYIERAQELHMRAIGISDHGNMINALQFQQECDKANIKPIFACEFYLGELETHNKFHILLIAKDNEGLENLYKLNAYAYTKNFYGKPRITWHQLLAHKTGLILTTACLGSEFGELFNSGELNELKGLIRICRDSFGNDLYIELQSNKYHSKEHITLKCLNMQ